MGLLSLIQFDFALYILILPIHFDFPPWQNQNVRKYVKSCGIPITAGFYTLISVPSLNVNLTSSFPWTVA